MNRTKAGRLNVAKDVVKEAGKNFLMGIPAFRRWRLKRPRAGAFFTGTDEELERYAFLGLNLLQEYSGSVEGKHVCEIGAGDYLTSGLAILAAGAASYTVIDRFPGDYSGAIAKNWYQGIKDNWTRFYPQIPWTKDLHVADFPEKYFDRIELIREPIETARPNKKYDIVCSFQVGEHISDLESFAAINERLLKPDGAALHRVDFGPHDCWFWYEDPLTFLQIPNKMWHLTGSNRGTPNRFRHHEFISAFEKAGLTVEIAKIDRFDESSIDFEKLNKKFQPMPRESLLVGVAIYKLRPNQAAY
ncbi:MAG: class I SAM-dependent methyltransferase [Acidobacteriota bacterium]|nr:class I SAM-dependent methyltransferase [Acidobacteriota bacterium]